MNQVQQLILEIFKEFKVPVDGIINPMSFRVNSWDRNLQDQFIDSIEKLIKEGYVFSKEKNYGITQKGYDLIYQNYSIKDTEELILSLFKKHKVGVDEILMSNNFTLFVNELERYHFDNFTNAIDSLIKETSIEKMVTFIH